MFDEKNIYVRQAEVKGSFKQNSNGVFLLAELTVNSSLKNYQRVLDGAFKITKDKLLELNENIKEKNTPPKTPPKKEKKPTVKGME